MSQVLVHRPRLRLRRSHRNLLLSSIVEQVTTALERFVKLRHPPRSQDTNRRLQGIKRLLQPNLIVSLPRRAVRHELTPFPLSNSNLGSRNGRASKRCSQEVDVLVHGVALNGGEAELLDELVAHVLDVALCSHLFGFGFDFAEVFVLAYVGDEAYYLETLFDEPGGDDARVKASAVGQADLLFRRHCGGAFVREICGDMVVLWWVSQ